MRVAVSSRARQDLRRLGRDVLPRVVRTIDELSRDPRPPGCRQLRGYHIATWRVRVGAWRVLYRIDDGNDLLTVVRVRHRSVAYRDAQG